MCSHFEAIARSDMMRQYFAVDNPIEPYKADVWPNYPAPFIRKHPLVDVGDEAVPAREALVGRFGLIPHWAKDDKIARHTYNARTETVAEKPSFRDAWRRVQHAIIPIQAFYEPNWRTGKARATRIVQANGEPMGIAGLWSQWREPTTGQMIYSFTMLTVNADQHPFMRQFHKPEDEKRMIVILPRDRFDEWLSGSISNRNQIIENSSTTPQLIIEI